MTALVRRASRQCFAWQNFQEQRWKSLKSSTNRFAWPACERARGRLGLGPDRLRGRWNLEALAFRHIQINRPERHANEPGRRATTSTLLTVTTNYQDYRRGRALCGLSRECCPVFVFVELLTSSRSDRWLGLCGSAASRSSRLHWLVDKLV